MNTDPISVLHPLRFRGFHWILFLVTLVSTPVGGQSSDAPNRLKIMSFNIRYGTADDGDNHWDLRKHHVVTTISDYRPDLLGTQETLEFQAAYLREHLKDYQYVGRSRDENDQGEQCGILFRTARFDLLESGHFWLSTSPNIPGSKSWDSALPRMVSWVKLLDKEHQRPLYFVNTHFDHRGVVARTNSAGVIVEHLKRFETGVPVILSGDFNSPPNSAPWKAITAQLVDSYQSLHPNEPNSGTFGGFQGKTDGVRIDFIFVSRQMKLAAAAIDRRNFSGHDPSDHFPVTCEVEFQTVDSPK